MSLLGIDVGSSRCKAVTFSLDGKPLASAQRTYTPSISGDVVELDPELLWHVFTEVIRDVARQTVTDPIAALAISSHGESFIPLDDRSHPIGMGIMNSDNRAAAEAVWWQAQIGREAIFHTTGAVPHPMYPLAKIEWMRRFDYERWKKTQRFASIGDYLLTRLGLPSYIDYSLASRYMAFDINKKEWSSQLLACAGLSIEQFPTPVPAGTVAGTLSPDIAAEICLPVGMLVAVGGHDQPISALGVGAIEPRHVAVSMGTYECLTATDTKPSLSTQALSASLNTYCHVVPDQYVTLAFFPSGIALQWIIRLLNPATSEDDTVYSQYEAAESIEPTGILMTPHLIGACNPQWDARARGAVYGITPTTTPGRMYRAALEGIACEYALNAEVLQSCIGEFRSVRATGGGTRSGQGLRLRASLSHTAIELPQHSEATCLGAALLAGVAAGHYSNLAEAIATTVHIQKVVEPETALSEAYRSQLDRYRAFYPALAPLREMEANR
jgi:xylulokinase